MVATPGHWSPRRLVRLKMCSEAASRLGTHFEHSLTVKRNGYLFTLLISRLFSHVVQNESRATRWDKPKMAQRQTEANFLRVLLLWLQEYWTD
jgi:hypothetical protein